MAMADAPDFAPLTSSLIRRARAEEWWEDADDQAEAGSNGIDWRADVRLFALTWAAGFVFFLTFIA